MKTKITKQNIEKQGAKKSQQNKQNITKLGTKERKQDVTRLRIFFKK